MGDNHDRPVDSTLPKTITDVVVTVDDEDGT
jgi:hypothetical protein